MKIKEVIKIAMAKNDIDGVMALVDKTGLSYDIVNRALKGDNSIKLKHVLEILNSMGYELKAVSK